MKYDEKNASVIPPRFLFSFEKEKKTDKTKITGVKNETSQTMLIQFNAAPKRIELQK